MQQAELIIAYLKGELPEDRRRELEKRLTTDPELMSALKDYQTILRGFKGMRHEAGVQEISNWNPDDEPEEEEILLMAFLDGTMEPAARKAFEAAMARDPELKRKVEDHQAIVQGFKGIQHEDFSREVAQWAEDLPGAEEPQTKVIPISRGSGLWRYGAVAAVLLLLVAAFWIFSPGGGSEFSYTAFLQENYIAPADPADRGEGEDAVLAATRNINRGDYAAAVDQLNTIAADDPQFAVAQFWLGHTYYQMENYETAVVAFSSSMDTEQLPDQYRDNAAWTRLLAQLAVYNAEGVNPEAKQQLETYLNVFLENADQSDTYYSRGLDLKEGLSMKE